jgi:hypothetical protein
MSRQSAYAYLDERELTDAWVIWEAFAESGDVPSGDENIVFDLVSRLIRTNRLSLKQEDFLRSLLVRISEHRARKAQWEEEAAGADPIPVSTEGERMVVSGEVLSIKVRETFNGSALKMVVRADEGWKVWGTVPASVRDSLQEGDVVRFTATVKPSDNDPKFGFFSRPTKATILHSASEDE